jgi:hypothetical protein
MTNIIQMPPTAPPPGRIKRPLPTRHYDMVIEQPYNCPADLVAEAKEERALTTRELYRDYLDFDAKWRMERARVRPAPRSWFAQHRAALVAIALMLAAAFYAGHLLTLAITKANADALAGYNPEAF